MIKPKMYAIEFVRGSAIYKELLDMTTKKICSVSGSSRSNLASALRKPADFKEK